MQTALLCSVAVQESAGGEDDPVVAAGSAEAVRPMAVQLQHQQYNGGYSDEHKRQMQLQQLGL